MHGYPPDQAAGTEQYARRVAEGMRRRGWEVLTIAVAPRPGARAYAVEEVPGLLRVAQNAPYASLRRGGADPAVDAIVGDALARFRPDGVHVQHLAHLSTTLPLPAPALWTVHDAWAICPAGGLLLRDGAPCSGPSAACGPCASAWVRDPPGVELALGAAGHLARWVRPERLHAAWRRIPGALRDRFVRAPAAPVEPRHLLARDAAVRAFAARCAMLVSPSAWLADTLARHGLPRPRVVPHGVDPSPLPRRGDGPLLFLGTLAPHKGPHLVAEAWRRAAVGVPLELRGPPGPDAAYAAALPHGGPIDAADVPALLSSARALVLGSVWPENAPLVVSEARAAGCPVIAPAIGGLPELVEVGRDGWLYPPGDVDALALAMRAATEGPPPPVRAPPSFDAHLDALARLYGDAFGAPP